jgi:hypothetical protein
MYYFTTLSMFFQLIIRLLLNFYKKIKNPTWINQVGYLFNSYFL